MSVDEAIREIALEYLEVRILGRAQVITWAFRGIRIRESAFEYVLNIFDHSIGQGHDGQVVGIIPKRIFNL